MMVGIIALRELLSLFFSPLAWVIMAVVQLILAYIFLARMDLFMEFQPRLMGVDGAPGLTDIVVAPLFVSAGVVFLLVAPLLTMRVLAEERHNGTLTLLYSAPLSMSEIVLGKYLGLLGFFLIMVMLIALMPLSLLVGGNLDLGQFTASLLGLVLLLAAFAAVGLFLSSLTAHPTVAGISSFGALLLLWILDWAGESEEVSGLFSYLSLFKHYQALSKGIFNSADVIYYLLLTGLFLGLTLWRLDADRLPR